MMKDILSYESEIWACADLLISSGIKQSKFPDYMMPFFALIMLEGRMRNEMRDIQEAEGIDPTENIEDLSKPSATASAATMITSFGRTRLFQISATTIRPLSKTSRNISQGSMHNSKNCSA